MQRLTHMKRICSFVLMASCALTLTLRAQRGGTGAPALVDWITDGGDNQRTGWARNETIITRDNVRNLKLLWKMETENQPRALHSLIPALIVGQLNTPSGRRQVGVNNGVSAHPYGFEVSTGKYLWPKH